MKPDIENIEIKQLINDKITVEDAINNYTELDTDGGKRKSKKSQKTKKAKKSRKKRPENAIEKTRRH